MWIPQFYLQGAYNMGCIKGRINCHYRVLKITKNIRNFDSLDLKE